MINTSIKKGCQYIMVHILELKACAQPAFLQISTINSNIISPDFLKANKQRIFEEEPYLNYYKQ
jgi:hypothetical protein